jgi:hypothetical protein
MKNLLTFVFFLCAYFYEIKQAIVDAPLCQWLAQLDNGKIEISRISSYWDFSDEQLLTHR